MKYEQLITAPGVYFDLPDEIYHASPGLSSSGVKNLLISPSDYWADAIDPDRKQTDTEANIFGRAMHRRTLEGQKDFYEHYAVLPDRSEYPDALTTQDQLKMKCKELGLIISGNVPDLIKRVMKEAPQTEIWNDIVDRFKTANENKVVLRADQGRDIEGRHEIIDEHPDAKKAFINGRPEVSIFWDDEELGIRMKSRIDYLKIKAAIDLKTFTNQRRIPIDRAIGLTVAQYQYHIQGFVYMRAIKAAKMLLINDRPTEHILEYIQDPANCDFIEKFMESKRHAFWFVFIESGKACNIRVRRFDQKNSDGITNAYFHAAEMEFLTAVNIYKQFMEAHPDPTTPWQQYVRASEFEDHEFPMYMTD